MLAMRAQSLRLITLLSHEKPATVRPFDLRLRIQQGVDS
jgi:hypothetical protein